MLRLDRKGGIGTNSMPWSALKLSTSLPTRLIMV